MNASQKASRSRAAEPSTPRTERRAQTVDNVLERCRHGLVKAGLEHELDGSRSLLRGAAALREMQLRAAQRTQLAHDEAQARLRQARSVAEAAGIGLQLAQADAQGAWRYWGEATDILLRSALDGWAEALSALAHGQRLAGETSRHWMASAQQSQGGEAAAEAEQVASVPTLPTAPLWPAAESMREAVTLGAKAWNDWLGTLPAVDLFPPAAPTATH